LENLKSKLGGIFFFSDKRFLPFPRTNFASRGLKETAKNLLQFGLSIENIAKATGLSQAEVEELHS